MKLKTNILYLGSLIILSHALCACKSAKKDDDTLLPVRTYYETGLDALEKKKYKDAASEFEKIFFGYPGHTLTPQAELMQAYSLYLGGEYDEAIDVLDVFIKLHPRNADIAYAYYLKALASYVQISDVKLDQSRTKAAKDDFEEIINRFPGTKYALDAALKIDLVNDHLAGKEMAVGRYYLSKSNPAAAISRFAEVVKEYSTTSHVPEALYRLVESNLILGLKDEARKYAAVLGHNYPDNRWYEYSYALLKN